MDTLSADSSTTPAANIRRTLREQGRKQGWLAEQLGLNQSYLSTMLTGQRPISAELVERIAEVLGVPVSDFTGGAA